MIRQRHADRLQGLSVPARYEFRAVYADGSLHWLEIHAGGIEYRGRPAVQVTLTDITECKQAEKQARELHEHLLHISRLSTLGEMASGLAHELSQPLSAILSYANASQRSIGPRDTDRERRRTGLDQVVCQAKRAGEIISSPGAAWGRARRRTGMHVRFHSPGGLGGFDNVRIRAPL